MRIQRKDLPSAKELLRFSSRTEIIRSAGCQIVIIYAVIHGFLDSVEVSKVRTYEEELYSKLEAERQELLNRLEAGSFEQCDIDEIETVLKEMQR